MNDQEKQDVIYIIEALREHEDVNLAAKTMRGHELIRIIAGLSKTLEEKEEPKEEKKKAK